MLCGLDQFHYRAGNAVKIGNLAESTDLWRTARKIWVAELFQLSFLASQTLLYMLAVAGYISPLGVGISTLILVPFEALAYRQIFVLDGKNSRIFMPITAVVSLTVVGIFSILGNPGDYAWTLCGGGFLVQLVRLSTERSDFLAKRRKVIQHA